MAQSLFTGQVPDSQDLTDGIVLMLGTYITPAVAGTVTHIRFRFPESSQDPVKAALFRVSDTTKISGTDPVFATPVLDDWNQVALAAPVAVSAGVEYCAAVRILRYTSSPEASVFPVTNGDLSAAGPGRYSTADPDGSVTFPNNASSSCYFADLVFQAAAPSEGSADTGLGLALAGTGARESAATAALSLDLAVAVAGSRPGTGDAATGLGLAVAATGARPAQGSAALSLALAPAGAGEHASEGSAALGLGLAVLARGANGDAGRPVSSFPWTPRPVRSFSEVEL